MNPEVLIEKVFSIFINNRTIFIVQCKLIRGIITSGMSMCLPFGAGLDITIPVDEIKFLAENSIEISVYCEDTDEADFLFGMNLVGSKLLVE